MSVPGARRNPNDWTQKDNRLTRIVNRGYTGHEHIDEFGVVNMNARLYDPALGRFLSPDPYVQAPDFLQNFNRYSYCLNNPLRYTDPSGESFVRFLLGEAKFLAKVVVWSVALGASVAIIIVGSYFAGTLGAIAALPLIYPVTYGAVKVDHWIDRW